MNTGVGCYALLQWIFPTQGSNQHLLHILHWQAGSLPLAPKCPQMTLISSLWAKFICLRGKISVRWGFHSNSGGKESTCNAGDLGLIPWLRRSLEKGTATHSSILAWKIQWTEEPGRLQSMGSQRARQTTYLPPEKSVCRSRSNSQNRTWNNRLVPNWERSMSSLYIVTLLI